MELLLGEEREKRADSRDLSFATCVQLILILHQFYICKFVYLQKFICDPQVSISRSFPDMVQIGEKLGLPGSQVHR